MREVRIFEMEAGEPAAAWRVACPSTFKVISGEIWLTVEGDGEDYWLAAGQSVELPRRASAWISGGKTGARFALASGSDRVPPGERSGVPGWDWLPRWLAAV